jgi:hypothetical protein
MSTSSSAGAARSVLVFGVYLLGQGAVLVAAPNLLLEPLGLGHSVEFWPRAAGIALLVLGLYYVLAARTGLVPFFRFTVLGRSLQLVIFVACVVAGVASWRVLPTAVFEAASGAWTFFELRRAGLWGPLTTA